MSDTEEKSGAESGGLVRRRRRRWSKAQKRQIVAETHEPGVSVPMVAQRYNLNANQVFRWRRLFREPAHPAGTGGFVPVVVGAVPGREVGAATMPPPSDDPVAAGPSATGRMEIVLAGGQRVIVDGAVERTSCSASSMRAASFGALGLSWSATWRHWALAASASS